MHRENVHFKYAFIDLTNQSIIGMSGFQSMSDIIFVIDSMELNIAKLAHHMAWNSKLRLKYAIPLLKVGTQTTHKLECSKISSVYLFKGAKKGMSMF